MNIRVYVNRAPVIDHNLIIITMPQSNAETLEMEARALHSLHFPAILALRNAIAMALEDIR